MEANEETSKDLKFYCACCGKFCITWMHNTEPPNLVYCSEKCFKKCVPDGEISRDATPEEMGIYLPEKPLGVVDAQEALCPDYKPAVITTSDTDPPEEEPREYTSEEAADVLIGHCQMLITYWNNESKKEGKDTKWALEGLVHSVLSALDGVAGGCPAFLVMPTGHPKDQEYCKKNGENWWPVNEEAEKVGKAVIQGYMHDRYNAKRS